jgi:broad specificity phosphatase PhoE
MSNSWTFIRHTEVNNNELSSSGIAIAKQRAYSFKDYSFDLVITSSASRTKKTARVITQTLNIDVPVVHLKELYFPIDIKKREIVEDMIQTLGEKPVFEYMKYDREKAWESYTEEAYYAIKRATFQNQAKNVLIVAHGNIINSIGLRINPKAKELENIYFGYCEGFILFLNTNSFEILA